MWHKECFKCGQCSKGLDSISCSEAPDGFIYCKRKKLINQKHKKYTRFVLLVLQQSV